MVTYNEVKRADVPWKVANGDPIKVANFGANTLLDVNTMTVSNFQTAFTSEDCKFYTRTETE